MKTVTRREFLKVGVGLGAVASGLEMIVGCAATETPKVTAVVYPPLPYNKIQPPQEGCLVGFFKESEADARLKDSRFIPQHSPEIEAAQRAKNIDEYLEMLKKENFLEEMKKHQVGNEINYAEKNLNAKPFTFVLLEPKLYFEFPVAESIAIAKRGIVPFVYGHPGPFDVSIPIPGFGPKELAQGQQDGYIKKFAQGAAEFGKEYGGFFFTTLPEMNGKWFSWGMNSNAIPAWRRIWQVFEDQGANQYATWVWEVYPYSVLPTTMVDSPESYYPGDRYVDWVGITGISVARSRYSPGSLYSLIDRTYRQMLKAHPQKPIMLSSFGRTNQSDQSNWLIEAYNSMKNSFPAIKAVIYFDNTWKLTGDHTLNQESFQTLQNIFKDPYWIMRRK
jgi:Glycosyl hydrolase family 26